MESRRSVRAIVALISASAVGACSQGTSSTDPGPRGDAGAGASAGAAGAGAGAGAGGEGGALAPQSVRFHHVHMNAVSLADSVRFYSTYFDAAPVVFDGRERAVRAGDALILFDEVLSPPDPALETTLEHVGWTRTSAESFFLDVESRGITVETPPTPLFPDFVFMYFRGPNGERIETTSGPTDDFAHVHLLATDLEFATGWYRDVFDLTPLFGEPMSFGGLFTRNNLPIDDVVSLEIFGDFSQTPAEPAPTDDRPHGHIAFAYRDLDRAFARLERAGLEIVDPIADRAPWGMRSFFVRGPDRVLLEIVEDAN